MATYKSTWQTKQEEKQTKLGVNPSATEVQREMRTASFAVTCTSANTSSSGGDKLILGRLGVAKHRILTQLARLYYGGTAWPGSTSVTLSLRRAPVTVGTDEQTLGSIACDGTVAAFTPAAAQQAEAGADFIYYLVCTATTGSPAAGVVYTIELPYCFEGI